MEFNIINITQLKVLTQKNPSLNADLSNSVGWANELVIEDSTIYGLDKEGGEVSFQFHDIVRVYS